MKLDRKLWRTADGKVVEDGHPDAAFLVGAEGQEIPDAEAEQLGIKKAERPADKAAPEPANKSRAK